MKRRQVKLTARLVRNRSITTSAFMTDLVNKIKADVSDEEILELVGKADVKLSLIHI